LTPSLAIWLRLLLYHGTDASIRSPAHTSGRTLNCRLSWGVGRPAENEGCHRIRWLHEKVESKIVEKTNSRLPRRASRVYGRGMNENVVRNVGILAHVDAGKTTTTEHLLYLSGQLRKVGRVDDGTAFADWLEVERARGISVRAATLSLTWKDTAINIIDTPGHVDFSAEVERVLRVLDGAVLMLSAVDGVQAHTEALWHALSEAHIPTLIYINKMDRMGADVDRVVTSVRALLTKAAVPIQRVRGGDAWNSAIEELLTSRHPSDWADVVEQLADYDDELLTSFLENEPIALPRLRQILAGLVAKAQVVPVLYGASLKGIGVRQLLDAMVDFLPAAKRNIEAPMSGVVFKVERQARSGRAVFVRLYRGQLQNRQLVANYSRGIEEKIVQIRKLNGQQQMDTGLVQGGDIAAIYGLNQSRIGDILGSPEGIPAPVSLSEPVLSVDVYPGRNEDSMRLAEALQELDDEDPTLAFEWLAETRECQVQVAGRIQIEILGELLATRYDLHPSFGPPNVLYRETPKQPGEGFVAYTMPKPCWAILRFAIFPGARGSGLSYRSEAHPDRLLLRYQREVERRVPEALEQGLKGWPVTDLSVILVSGEHHVWHTHPLDFVVATPMAIMDGLTHTGTQLLEPILSFRTSVPEEVGGRVMSDLIQMRAVFDPPMVKADYVTLEGEVPLATSMDYGVALSMLTRGHGKWSTRFLSYRPAPEHVTAERPRRGVDPRDRAKYILAVRQALKT